MAWGKGGGLRSCDALLKRVEQNDPNLLELVVLPMKTFGSQEVHRLANILASGVNTHLESLSASGHNIPPEALEALGKALATGKSNLVHLAIGDSSMGDAGVCALCQGFASSGSLKLETIDLSWKEIGPEGMASIVQNLGTRCPLKTLNLARNDKIGSLDFSSSSSSIFPNLKQLDLSDCGLDAKSCTWLAQALSSTTELELKVNSNSNLGEQGTASLMGLSLKELHVSKCNIGDAGLQHIVNHSSNEVGLQILDLSHNNLSPTGIQYLANQLQEGGCSLPQLDELNIAGNQLDEASSQALAVAFGDLRIKEKLSISRLDMTDTSCGVNGAVDLIRLSQLKNLILFNNRLGSDGFVALAKVLQGGHPTLETLDVGGNEATEAGVVALVQAFTIKSESFQNALRLVVVGGNASGPTIETVVKEIKKVHPEMDIARDKAGKQQQQSDGTGQTQLPPGMLQT